MKTTLRFFTIGILSLLVFGMATSTQPAWACTGGYSPTIEEKVGQAPFIVRGHIIEVDDAGSNAIMHVSEYLKGEGAEYILLALDSPTSILFRYTRYSGGGCFYGVSGMRLENEIIIFLSKDINGSYVLASGNYTFTHNYYRDSEHHPLLPEGITSLDELSLHIQTFTGQIPQSPIQDMPYPLIAPLFITTELGSEYLIPIDGSAPVTLTDEVMA
ncbi:MAG TPA: hypothetical protein PLZ51_01685, partial [Aggregatilineales bacterium]|nr:hypothetical protein [Aggregatilineales bacterium]